MARGDNLFRQWELLKVLQNNRFGQTVDDLASDVENLPGVGEEPAPKVQPATYSEMPTDLANLAENPSPLHSVVARWGSLPDHIRQSIATLCAGSPATTADTAVAPRFIYSFSVRSPTAGKQVARPSMN